MNKECPIRLFSSELCLTRGLNSAAEAKQAYESRFCIEDKCPLWVLPVACCIKSPINEDTFELEQKKSEFKPGHCGLIK